MQNVDMKEAANEELDTFHPIGLAAERLVSNLIKLRELSEVLDGPAVVCDGSIDWGFEGPKMKAAPVLRQPGDKGTGAAQVDALEAAHGSEGTLIRIVLLAGRFSQITEGVVIPTTVDMVDQISRPLTSHVEPCEARGAVELPVDANNVVAMHRNAAGATADQISPTALSYEMPGLRIVVDRLLQPVARNHDRYLNLQKKHDEDRERQTGRDRTDEEKSKDQRDYIDTRLRELRAWERRVSGKNK